MSGFVIALVSPDEPAVRMVLDRHLALMQSQTPPESCHALPTEALAAENISLFALCEDGKVLGIGALSKQGAEGELKSMHTVAQARGRGVARALLAELIGHAQSLGLTRVNLETGSGPDHAAARALYASAGFETCAAFGSYRADPLSHFMTRAV